MEKGNGTVVVFKLKDDPTEYKLSFDFNEVCNAELVAGINLMECLVGGSINAGQTRALLYACLKPGHPLVLLPEAGELMSRDMPTVLGALTQAMAEARGTGDEEPVIDPPAPVVEPAAVVVPVDPSVEDAA